MNQDPRPARSRSTAIKLAAAAAVIMVVVIVAATVDLPDPESIRTLVADAGAWGIVAFVILYVVLSATPFPASALTIASGLLFGLAVGATVVVVAATGGAYVGYWAARALGRGSVARSEWGKLRRLDAMLGRRGLMSVFIVRLIPVFPFSVVNYAAGISAVGQRDYLLGTAVGIIPATVGFTALGAYGTSPLSWPFAAALVAVLVIGVGSSLAAKRFALKSDPEPNGPHLDGIAAP
ncbi:MULTISPECIES: TVP38/TMEM64 family protein [unclassified Rhodococcus (in: high G+C Gram-positive bacteria)]|uniref:TVP38/TMEM64 family protein n=1 Tax=unclassified Rhodococcus (in: high G+C Gram-positive bacteria) TaxID=192944 RepID=UPI001FFBC4C1|nr:MULTISPECIES: TVP38/TMEM64 family protein [unclassified Rhodococcus (in: high G+C Gram-positive bacteria)]